MKQAIIDLIKNKGGSVTCAELCREVPGFAGDRVWEYNRDNLVLWIGVSTEAVSAMNDLLDKKAVAGMTTPVLTYLFDGDMLTIPLAKNPKRQYKTPHWLPIAFWLPDQISADMSRAVEI